jgi:hypothetical protein
MNFFTPHRIIFKDITGVVLFLYCAPLTLRAGPSAERKELFSCLPSIYPCSARCAPWAMLGKPVVAPTALHLRGQRIFFSFEVKTLNSQTGLRQRGRNSFLCLPQHLPLQRALRALAMLGKPVGAYGAWIGWRDCRVAVALRVGVSV